MAGIGFELKKLFKEEGVFSNIRAYSYATVVTVGPMALCILLITLVQQLLRVIGTPLVERELFLAATEYAFIFSQILTGGFNLVISRFVADQTFLNRWERVLSSMYGVIGICVFIGGISAFFFLFHSPLSLSFKISSYLLFTELTIIWIQCMYVSALKDYLKIVKSFLIGVLISGVSVWITVSVLDFYTAEAILVCFNVGFLFIIIMFMKYIKAFFRVNNQSYFDFITYLEKYPALFFCGLFYSIGLYGHNLVVWQGSLQVEVGETFIIAPFYDVPVFYSYLTILPALVLFMVSVETSFYRTYKAYYERILQSAPLQDILAAKKEMQKVISLELTFITEMQLLVTVCSIAIGTEVLPWIGLTPKQIDMFIILCLANFLFSLMFTIMLILLYFDDRKGAMITTTIFVLSSIVVTVITLSFENYGFSVFIASFVSLGVSIVRLISYQNNLDYYTFCSQPLVHIVKISRSEKLLQRVKRYY